MSDEITKLLGDMIGQFLHVYRLGLNLEEDQNTKIIGAEISLIAENGKKVFVLSMMKDLDPDIKANFTRRIREYHIEQHGFVPDGVQEWLTAVERLPGFSGEGLL